MTTQLKGLNLTKIRRWNNWGKIHENSLWPSFLSGCSLLRCVVITPTSAISGSTITGSLTEDCGVVSNVRVNSPAQDSASGDPNKNSQSECSFVVVDSNRIIAAFFDTHLSEYALGNAPFSGITSPRSTGWTVSVNGGASFTDNGAIPPTVPASTSQGDAGDPVMARNTSSGHIYLLVNPSRESSTWRGFRLWRSTDNGQSFSLINSDIFLAAAVQRGDKPMIAVNNFAGLSNSGHLYAAGSGLQNNAQGVFVAHSSNGGVNWDNVGNFPGNAVGADIVIRPDGTVYVFYIVNGPSVSLWYSWRRTGDSVWHTPVQIAAHANSQSFYSANLNGSGNPKRSNSATTGDYFVNNAFPRVAVNPVNGRVYIVYADLPFAGSTTDRGDIFINEGVPSPDGSLTFTSSGARRANNDGTLTDQWNPSIAINPTGTQLFVGYYSRQGDPNNNALIQAYGAKANLANGFTAATFDVFPISATAFPPLFAGTADSTPPQNWWMYDHVWVQDGVCLNLQNATVIVPVPSSCPDDSEFSGGYASFMADDYTWVSSDGSFFYFAWCDRSDTYSTSQGTRRDPNIRFGKIRQ